MHRDVVCAENAEHLLRAATTLQIKGMITRCEEYLMDNLSEKNCITMWKLGRTHNCEELEDRSWPLILLNFNELSRTDDFQVSSNSGLSGYTALLWCLYSPSSSTTLCPMGIFLSTIFRSEILPTNLRFFTLFFRSYL